MIRITPFTADDLSEIVAVHTDAFPGFFLTSLGGAFLREFYRAFVAGAGNVGFVARDESDRIVGVVVGALNPRGFYTRLLRRRWLAFGLAAVPGLLRRPTSVARLLGALRHPGRNDGRESAAGLFSIAVSPRCQSGGVGTRLVESFREAVFSRGATVIFLTTDTDANDATNAFYLRRGFALSRQYVTDAGRRMNEYSLAVEQSRTNND